ncbi:acetyltransferase [Arthrobacter sp. Hiyo1]|nr:acetyltransferase [Arthrobacter sp. Hiyo1]
MWGSAIWPVTLESGDLILRPIHYRDKKEWTEVRSRNSDWLAPWEASNRPLAVACRIIGRWWLPSTRRLGKRVPFRS